MRFFLVTLVLITLSWPTLAQNSPCAVAGCDQIEDTEVKSVNMISLIAPLVEAVNTLQAELISVKSENEKLKLRIDALEEWKNKNWNRIRSE